MDKHLVITVDSRNKFTGYTLEYDGDIVEFLKSNLLMSLGILVLDINQSLYACFKKRIDKSKGLYSKVNLDAFLLSSVSTFTTVSVLNFSREVNDVLYTKQNVSDSFEYPSDLVMDICMLDNKVDLLG